MDNTPNEILNGNIEDMRNKMKIMELDNQKINEQLFSLQNKFYVQTKILNDKNAELSKEVSKAQKIQSDHDKLLKEATDYKTQSEKTSKLNELLQQENTKLKNEVNDFNKKYNETNLKSNYLIGQLEEQNSILSSQNVTMKEASTRLQSQLDFAYNDMKAKESKLIFTLKNENKETEKNLRNELIELRRENDNLSQEIEQLRNEKMTLSNELNCVITESKNLAKSMNTSIASANTNKMVSQLEGKVTTLLNENKDLKDRISALDAIGITNDKKMKALKLDLQQCEKDAKNYYEMTNERETKIISLEKEMEVLKCHAEQQINAEILMKENASKNETINYLLDQVEKTKQEMTTLQKEGEIKLEQMNLNTKSLNEKLDNAQAEIEETVKTYQEKLNDLKSENEILVNDLNNKENEYNELLNDKVMLEAKYDEQFKQAEDKCESIQKNISRITKENDDLKEKINQCINISSEKYNSLNNKVIKQKKKLESLMNVYETHIKFLKERFDHILNDLLIVFNLKSNPKELNDSFAKIIKSVENSIDLINKIAEREALLENFKVELKTLNINLTNSNNQIKTLEKENYDLAQAANVKKLQMKLKPINPYDSLQYDIFSMLKEMTSAAEMNTQNCSLRSKANNQLAEIKMLNDKLATSQEQYKTIEGKYNDIMIELTNKTKDYNDLNKTYKSEMKNLVDEVKRIKETWTPYEKKMEMLTTIETLEKTIKGIKEDSNRKREMISSLKAQIMKNDNDVIAYNTKDLDTNNLNEKIKTLTKDIARKDVMLKELKNANDYFKSTEKRYNEENESLTEKIKLSKIEIGRKDTIIKELKDKLNNTINCNNTTTNSTITQSQTPQTQYIEKITRLKSEIDRKDNIIKTLKAKNEAVDIELNQMKTMNVKSNKISQIELEKEQKLRNYDQSKMNDQLITIEKMSSCFRRLSNDLLNSYEKLKIRSNLSNMTNTMKEGMDILGVNENEVGDYLNQNDENYNYKKEIEGLLKYEGKNFDSDKMVNILNTIKEQINQVDYNYKNNLSTNSFVRSNNNNNNFINTGKGKDNPFEDYLLPNNQDPGQVPNQNLYEANPLSGNTYQKSRIQRMSDNQYLPKNYQ